MMIQFDLKILGDLDGTNDFIYFQLYIFQPVNVTIIRLNPHFPNNGVNSRAHGFKLI